MNWTLGQNEPKFAALNLSNKILIVKLLHIIRNKKIKLKKSLG
jgi:hypothetical protein